MPNKAKHTPGPWTHSYGQYVVKSDSGIIARTNIEHHQENEANARLIAAAPELLEAAKALLRVGGSTKSDVENLERAIAKAEGK